MKQIDHLKPIGKKKKINKQVQKIMFLVTLQLFSVCFSVSRHVVRLVATQSEHVVPLLISAVTRIKCHLPAVPHYSQLCTVKELCPNSP